MLLCSLRGSGGQRRGSGALLALPGKDGQLHGIDPSPMRIAWSVPTTTREKVDAPLTHTGATRFCPGLRRPRSEGAVEGVGHGDGPGRRRGPLALSGEPRLTEESRPPDQVPAGLSAVIITAFTP